MNDEKTPELHSLEDGTVCPFCGAEYYDSCRHQLASIDSDTDQGGVLGPGWVESVIYAPARVLGLAIKELLEAVWQGDILAKIEVRQAKLEALTRHASVEWWGWVVEEIANNDNCPDDDIHLGHYATFPVIEVVQDVPGVLIGEPLNGALAGVYFLWSNDREAATQALTERIGEATQAVRSVTKAVSDEN